MAVVYLYVSQISYTFSVSIQSGIITHAAYEEPLPVCGERTLRQVKDGARSCPTLPAATSRWQLDADQHNYVLLGILLITR